MTERITVHDAAGSWVYEYSSDPEIVARESAERRKEYEAWRKAKLAQMARRRTAASPATSHGTPGTPA